MTSSAIRASDAGRESRAAGSHQVRGISRFTTEGFVICATVLSTDHTGSEAADGSRRYSQPAIFAVEYALSVGCPDTCGLWWGILILSGLLV